MSEFWGEHSSFPPSTHTRAHTTLVQPRRVPLRGACGLARGRGLRVKWRGVQSRERGALDAERHFAGPGSNSAVLLRKHASAANIESQTMSILKNKEYHFFCQLSLIEPGTDFTACVSLVMVCGVGAQREGRQRKGRAANQNAAWRTMAHQRCGGAAPGVCLRSAQPRRARHYTVSAAFPGREESGGFDAREERLQFSATKS